MRHCNSTSAFGAFLGGALVGGIVALLLAPRSGAETRGIIRDYANEGVDYARGKAAQGRKMARRAVSEIEGLVDEAKESVAKEIAATKRAARRVAKSE